MQDNRPRRRRPMEQNPTRPAPLYRPQPTLEQMFVLLQANNALLLGIVARLERLEQGKSSQAAAPADRHGGIAS